MRISDIEPSLSDPRPQPNKVNYNMTKLSKKGSSPLIIHFFS